MVGQPLSNQTDQSWDTSFTGNFPGIRQETFHRLRPITRAEAISLVP